MIWCSRWCSRFLSLQKNKRQCDANVNQVDKCLEACGYEHAPNKSNTNQKRHPCKTHHTLELGGTLGGPSHSLVTQLFEDWVVTQLSTEAVRWVGLPWCDWFTPFYPHKNGTFWALVHSRRDNFSPHHCVGFLFFALHPPLLLLRLPRPRLKTIHHTPFITHHPSHTTHHSSHSIHHTLLITLHSSHTTHHAPLITYHSSHTTHHTPLITHHSSHTTHHTPLITDHSSHTIHHTPLDTHHSTHTIHPLITYHSSHTTHHTPLITHHSSHTTHHTPLITHHSSHTIHHTPLITHHSSQTTHHTPFITHHSSHTIHHTPFITHHSTHTTHHTPFITDHSSHTTHHTPFITHHSSHTIHHTPFITHHSTHTTHHTPLITDHSSHTTRHTPLITYHSSQTTHHTPLITYHSKHTTHHTPLITYHSKHTKNTPLITHHSSHTTHHAVLLRGRRSTESLLKELLRAWSPLGAAGPRAGFCVAGAVQRASWRSCCALGRRWAPLGRAVAFAWQVQYREPPEGAAARLVAAGRRSAARWLLRGKRSTESLLKELLRAWSPLGAAGPRAGFCVAGAVQRASWRSFCALGRRWAPLGRSVAFVWQAQYREPPGGASARLVAAGRRWGAPCFCVAGAVQRASWRSCCALGRRWAPLGRSVAVVWQAQYREPPGGASARWLLRGRRSTESLLTELLRAWSPLGAAGPRGCFCVAGAVQRASWRSCCALGRRWAPLGRAVVFAWQAQYREPPEGAAARLVAAGRRWAVRWLLRGRRSIESLLKELLRAWSPLGAAGPCGGFCVAGAVQRASWTSFCALRRRWAQLGPPRFLCGRRSTESLLEELLRAWSPRGAAGPRFAAVWQAQYREPSGGAAARVVAAGRRWAALRCCVAGAVQRAFWRSCCALGRRWAPLGPASLLCGRRSTESLLEELLRAWSPRAASCFLCGRRSTESLLEELLRAWSPLGAAAPRVASVW